MFASYEVATSFPSLTAIKGYDLDKSADVPLMGHFMSRNDKIRYILLRQRRLHAVSRKNEQFA